LNIITSQANIYSSIGQSVRFVGFRFTKGLRKSYKNWRFL